MAFDPPPGSGGPPELPPPDGDAPPWWDDGGSWDDGAVGEGLWDDGTSWGTGTFARRPRSRVLRVVGIGVAAALLLASIGTTLEAVLGGSSTAALPTTVTGIVPLLSAGTASSGDRPALERPGPGTKYKRVEVTFTVLNDSASAVVPVCKVAVIRRGKVLGSRVVSVGSSLAGGAEVADQVSVPVERPAVSKVGARVACEV